MGKPCAKIPIYDEAPRSNEFDITHTERDIADVRDEVKPLLSELTWYASKMACIKRHIGMVREQMDRLEHTNIAIPIQPSGYQI